MTLSSNGNRTCHKTACQVLASSIEPWAAMVENRVCPELFLTEGRVSRHKSRNLQYKHIHNLSKDDMFLLPGKDRKHSGNNICWSLSCFWSLLTFCKKRLRWKIRDMNMRNLCLKVLKSPWPGPYLEGVWQVQLHLSILGNRCMHLSIFRHDTSFTVFSYDFPANCQICTCQLKSLSRALNQDRRLGSGHRPQAGASLMWVPWHPHFFRIHKLAPTRFGKNLMDLRKNVIM